MCAHLRFAPALVALLLCQALTAADIAPIQRVLPPEGIEIPADVRTRLESRLAETKQRLDSITDRVLKPDVEVFTKAVEFALLHREFYAERDFRKADWALDEANQRLDALASGQSPWTTATGLVALGYRSAIDGSAQPYGLVIPDNLDQSKPCPLYVWLHGRGDKNTDLHFLNDRATRPGQITPSGAIVAHAFGRQCIGYKGPGEVDVRDVVRSVRSRYKIDPDRIVLIGFSMGGAGAWLVGSHSAGEWAAVSPGAGYVDVLRYQRLDPEKIPAYEKKLWGLNDVPDYVRNLFNTKTIAYSGELDKQRAAAVIMEEAFKAEGQTLTHLIGPGVEHKYEPNTLADLLKRLDSIVTQGRERFPKEAHLQTRTLRYYRESWIYAERLEEHWADARIDATRQDNHYNVTTKSIARFMLLLAPETEPEFQFTIDGQRMGPGPRIGFVAPGRRRRVARTPEGKIARTPEGRIALGELSAEVEPGLAFFVKENGSWQWLRQAATRQLEIEQAQKFQKKPGLTGPIDDIFNWPFIVVAPSGKSKNPRFQAWVDFELAHFRDRWRALMRGEPPIKLDSELTEADMHYPLVLWGDPDSNSAIARVLDKQFVDFQNGKWQFGGQPFDGDRYVPALIYPRRVSSPTPGAPGELGAGYRAYHSYVVLNSGLTFREGHDRTNSQQNPKLPDWAIIDLAQPPDSLAPGRIHDADFFDENWQLKRQPLAAQQ